MKKMSFNAGCALFVVFLSAFNVDSSARNAPSQSAPAESAMKNPGLPDSEWSNLMAVHNASRYFVRPGGKEGTWVANNPANGWRTEFDSEGFLIVAATGKGLQWNWGLEFAGHGRGEAWQQRSKVPSVTSEEGRLVYHWDPSISEWFVNDSDGVEHGFTIMERKEGPHEKDLALKFNVRGGLKANVSADGKSISFSDEASIGQLSYGGLKVWDADGRFLDSRFESSGGNGSEFCLLVDDSEARYPLNIDPVVRLDAYVKASNTGANDQFGYSVAIDGDTAVVGAIAEASNGSGPSNNSSSNSGAAYVYVRSGATWTEQGYLKASDPQLAQFGTSVAVMQDVVVVGAPRVNSSQGAVYVFTRSSGSWNQSQKLEASNKATGDFYGNTVDVTKNYGTGDYTIVIGAYAKNSSTGAIYIYRGSGSSWTETIKEASNKQTGDGFGYSVAIDGDFIVAGALAEDSNATGVGGNESDNSTSGAGAAYVFQYNGSAWNQIAYLKADTVVTSGAFGKLVDISGSTIAVVGSKVYILAYSPSTGTWVHQATPLPLVYDAADNFGAAIGLDGNYLIVGAWDEDGGSAGANGDPSDNSLTQAGAAYVFRRDGTTWNEVAYLKATNPGTGDGFGRAVAISGDTVIMGSRLEDGSQTGVNPSNDNLASNAGAAYIYTRIGGDWRSGQEANFTSSNINAGDRFADSIDLDGDTLVVGAFGEDGNRVSGESDNSCTDSGAAYIYVRSGSSWSQQAYIKCTTPVASARFGASVSISGDTIAVGAPGDGAGKVFIFTRSSSTWTQQASLQAAAYRDTGDNFGAAVSLVGGILLIGAPHEDSGIAGDPTDNSAASAGAAYVFSGSGSSWTQTDYLKKWSPVSLDQFGASVADGGDHLYVGCPWDSTFVYQGGAVYAFEGALGYMTISQYFTDPDGIVYMGNFGQVIAAGDGLMAVSSMSENEVYLYKYRWWGPTIISVGKLTPSGGGASDQFGKSIAVSNSTIIVGSWWEDSNATGLDGDRTNNSSSDSGAAYVYIPRNDEWVESAYIKASNTSAGDFFGNSVAIDRGLAVVGTYGGGCYTFSDFKVKRPEANINNGNVAIRDVVYDIGIGGIGEFSNGFAAGLPVNSGLVLSTGNVLFAGVNDQYSPLSRALVAGGDADLEAEIPLGSLIYTHDAPAIEFDMKPDHANVSFTLVFASEEYGNISPYEDGVAIFVDGVNIAKYTVSGVSKTMGVGSVNSTTNSSLYIANDPSPGPAPYPMHYDGFTKEITFSVGSLSTSTWHTVKIVIGDAYDNERDSAVFLKAGSLKSYP